MIEVSKTMTTKEYLEKINNDKLNKEFDEMIRIAKEKEMSKLAEQERQNTRLDLIRKISDYDVEISICEDIIFKRDNSIDYSKFDIEELKHDCTKLKVAKTKAINKLNLLDKEEEEICKNQKKITCSICGKKVKEFGNNAWPVNKGTCCNHCNDIIVIPRRLQDIINKREEQNKGSDK